MSTLWHENEEVIKEFVKIFRNSNKDLKVILCGFSCENSWKGYIVKKLVDDANEAKKETVFSQMASFLWANKEAGVEHKLYIPNDVACNIIGCTDYPALEIETLQEVFSFY